MLMRKILSTIAWSRMIRHCLSRSAQFLLVLFALSTTAYAQDNTQKVNLHQLLKKHSIEGILPKPSCPVAMPEQMRQSRRASTVPTVFPDSVWFPGEWEEVQAIVITINYNYFVPGFEYDSRYAAAPTVPGYARYFFKETEDTPAKEIGVGPYFSKPCLDVNNDSDMVCLYIIDGIQRAGVEAWVRIDKMEDEVLILGTMAKLNLRTDNIHFFKSGGNSIWIRDCGPICFYYGDEDKLAMLDFYYGNTRPMDDMLPSILHQWKGIPNYINYVVWEGGNCLVDGVGGLMTSTAVHNVVNTGADGPFEWDGDDYKTINNVTKAKLTDEQVDQALEGMLGQGGISVVERLNNDGNTGHVDLYADAIDENGFLFAQMPDIYSTWGDYAILENNVDSMLKKKNFWGNSYVNKGRLPFPAKDDGSPFESEVAYGKVARTYANHLLVNGWILQPCFSPVGDDGMPTADWDRANIKAMMDLYPGYKFYCIDMRSFDDSGGSIHCVTKQIPADNPVRILHKCLHDEVNLGTLEYVPFSAVITNKSGIKEARLFYLVGEKGEWKQADMTGNGNRWYCNVPAAEFANGQTAYYFIQATSNNDKTVTKPITADNGGYYYFTVDNAVAYTDDVFDFSTEPMPKANITFKLDTSWLREDTTKVVAPTGIREVAAGQTVNAPQVWYTIDGRQLTTRPTGKGIYIFNGKKYVIK